MFAKYQGITMVCVVIIIKYLYCCNTEKTTVQDTIVLCKY